MSKTTETPKARPAKLGTQCTPTADKPQQKSSRSASLSPRRATNDAGFRVAQPQSKPPPKTRSASHARVPASKVEVGTAPPPNINQVKSRIGSMDNMKHKPLGGNVKVETQKLEWKVDSRVGSMQNANYRPGGGDKKIVVQKVSVKGQSKIGSLENATYKPGGGKVKVESQKLNFKEKAQPKVKSLDNVKHVAGGGNVRIFDQKYAVASNRTSSACSGDANERTSVPQTPTTHTEAPLAAL